MSCCCSQCWMELWVSFIILKRGRYIAYSDQSGFSSSSVRQQVSRVCTSPCAGHRGLWKFFFYLAFHRYWLPESSDFLILLCSSWSANSIRTMKFITTTAAIVLAVSTCASATSQIVLIHKSGTPQPVPSPPATMPMTGSSSSSGFDILEQKTIFHALPLFQELSGGPWNLPNFRDFQPRQWEMRDGAPRRWTWLGQQMSAFQMACLEPILRGSTLKMIDRGLHRVHPPMRSSWFWLLTTTH